MGLGIYMTTLSRVSPRPFEMGGKFPPPHRGGPHEGGISEDGGKIAHMRFATYYEYLKLRKFDKLLYKIGI